jgi:glycine betaine/proline transport system permease protein
MTPEDLQSLVDDATFGLFTFTELTRAIAAVVEVPYTVALSLLSTGLMRGEGSNAVQLLPPPCVTRVSSSVFAT